MTEDFEVAIGVDLHDNGSHARRQLVIAGRCAIAGVTVFGIHLDACAGRQEREGACGKIEKARKRAAKGVIECAVFGGLGGSRLGTARGFRNPDRHDISDA